MGSLIRDNKLLLSKLAKSIHSPDDTHGMILHCSGVSDGMSVSLSFYSKNNNRIQIVIPIEKEDIEYVEVKDSVYICLNTDRMCHMNRARFVGSDMLRDRIVTEYKSFDGFFKDYFQYNVEQYIRDDFKRFQSGIHEGAQFKTFMLVLEFLNSETDYTYYDNAIDDNHEFELAIQYIIDNHMIEEVISYNESVMRKFFYESLEKCVESPNAFNVARDGYYENGLLGVVKVDFKNLKYIAFDGVSTYDKITFSKSSNKICGGDLDYVFNGRIEYLGNVVRSSIKICKAPGVNRYTGKLVGVSGLLSHKSFELSAHWRGVH
jgi:hypothetical protein